MTQKTDRVYAISGAGLVKIGHSTQVGNRMQSMQAGCPVKLVLDGSCVGGEREERSLHKLFADVREHGEWFRLDEDDIKELKEILADEKELAGVVHQFMLKLPPYLRTAEPKEVERKKPRRRGVGTYQVKGGKGRGGSVRIGTKVQCKWCGKTFKTTGSLRSWCSSEHRALSKGL